MNVRIYYLVIILLLCRPIFTKAQVINIENGFSFAKAPEWFPKRLHPYQMSAGIEYMDKGWYNLTTNIGFLKKGGEGRISYGDRSSFESYKDWLAARYITLNTTFDVKAYTYDNFILYFAAGPRLDLLINNTWYYKQPEDGKVHRATGRNLNQVMWGLKCGIGVKKQLGNLQLGLHAAWLPSFNNMFTSGIKDFKMKDRTISLGASIGYIFNTSGEERFYSVKNNRTRNRLQ